MGHIQIVNSQHKLQLLPNGIGKFFKGTDRDHKPIAAVVKRRGQIPGLRVNQLIAQEGDVCPPNRFSVDLVDPCVESQGALGQRCSGVVGCPVCGQVDDVVFGADKVGRIDNQIFTDSDAILHRRSTAALDNRLDSLRGCFGRCRADDHRRLQLHNAGSERELDDTNFHRPITRHRVRVPEGGRQTGLGQVKIGPADAAGSIDGQT